MGATPTVHISIVYDDEDDNDDEDGDNDDLGRTLAVRRTTRNGHTQTITKPMLAKYVFVGSNPTV